MGTTPTPEECGRKILAIFSRFNTGPNEMLRHGSLHSAFLDDGFRAAEFGTAVHWLEARGLVDTKGNATGPYFLTQAGFAAI